MITNLILSKLVDQCDNTYNHSVNKTFINADYSPLTEKIEANSKALKFNVNDRVSFLVKTLKIVQKKYLLSMLF